MNPASRIDAVVETFCSVNPDHAQAMGWNRWLEAADTPAHDETVMRALQAIRRCRIPDDCIDSKRYPLFIARTVLRELIESLEPTGSVKP